jgi:hypothetical protein
MRTTGWRSRSEAIAELGKPDILQCESVGFLVEQTNERIMLALNVQAVDGGEPMVGETIIIPRPMIVSITAWTGESSA